MVAPGMAEPAVNSEPMPEEEGVEGLRPPSLNCLKFPDEGVSEHSFVRSRIPEIADDLSILEPGAGVAPGERLESPQPDISDEGTPSEVKFDRTTISVAICVFIMGAHYAAIGPFGTLWLKNEGYTMTMIGIYPIVRAFSVLIFSPLISRLVDSYQIHAESFALFSVVCALVGLLYVPFAQWFWLLMILTVVSQPLSNMAAILLDAMTLHGFPKKYFGYFRALSAVGYGMFSAIMGWMIDYFDGNLDIIFYAFSTLTAVMVIVWLIGNPKISHEVHEVNYSQLMAQLKDMVNTETVCVMVLLFIGGINYGCVETWEFVRIAEVGGGPEIMGLAQTVGVFTELPFWFYGYEISKKWGIVNTLVVCLVVNGLMNIVWGIMWHPYFVFIPEAFNGFKFALIWVSACTYAAQLVTPDLKATIQMALSIMYFGLGASLGGMLGGVVYQAIGAGRLFGGLCALSLVTAIVCLFANKYWPRVADAQSVPGDVEMEVEIEEADEQLP